MSIIASKAKAPALIDCPACGHEFDAEITLSSNDSWTPTYTTTVECPDCNKPVMIDALVDIYVCMAAVVREGESAIEARSRIITENGPQRDPALPLSARHEP